MNNEAQKGEIELLIFNEFADRADLKIVQGSAAKRNPPEPDILCTLVSGEFVAFELAEACAPEFAAARSLAIQQTTAVAFGADVSVETILKKLKKTYKTPYPVELLLYTNGMTALRDTDIISDVAPHLANGLGPFRRIWLMGDSIHVLSSVI
jgi:hypothetical protein